MKRAVFLDRDGVLNRAFEREGVPHPPASLAELEMLPGVVEACQALHAAGFLLVMTTNQPDVARGTQSRANVEAMNAAIARRLALDDVRVCYHTDGDGCDCRKPLPGMLRQAAADLGIDLQQSYMVGDRWRDVQAGATAGCKTVLIEYGYSGASQCVPDHRAASLREAAEWIVQQERKFQVSSF